MAVGLDPSPKDAQHITSGGFQKLFERNEGGKGKVRQRQSDESKYGLSIRCLLSLLQLPQEPGKQSRRSNFVATSPLGWGRRDGDFIEQLIHASVYPHDLN
jgi:hypothetical protein